MTGTLMKKTEPHQKFSSSQPPMTGPMAMPIPEKPAQMPMARPRSSAGKTLVTIESVEGMISAPPMPMSARKPIRLPGLAGVGAELADERGQGDVENRVVKADHQQAQAKDGQRPPTPLVCSIGVQSVAPFLSNTNGTVSFRNCGAG